MRHSRRAFLFGGGASLIASFTIGCGGEAYNESMMLGEYLERSGALFAERICDEGRGRVVIGWKERHAHFPHSHEKLHEGDPIFFITLDGEEISDAFLDEVPLRGVKRVDVHSLNYQAKKNVRHDEI